MGDSATFLGRVREALGARPPGVEGAARRIGDLRFQVESARQRAAARWEELWQQFAKETEAVGGQGHRAPDAAGAAAIIAEVAERRGARKIVTWDLAALGFGSVVEALRGRGYEVINASPPRAQTEDPAAQSQLRAVLAEADLGITGADYAIAETGSLLLISGEGRSRLVSLLPRTHVALIRPEHLVPAMRDVGPILAVAHRDGRAAHASCLNFITGPSRSADIEFVLARGVHGPAEVHVILIATSNEV
jgi:L-lactate utilization protein LutC